MDKLAAAALEFLKLAPRYLAAVAVGCALLLFAPDGVLKRMGVLDFQQNNRERIGLLLLGSGVLVLADWSVQVVGWIRNRMRERKFANFQTQRLNSLTEEEKQILRYYMAKQTRTNVLRYDDGVVQGLVALGIIYRASTMGSVMEGFAHNISEFAWEYLHEHPAILNGTTQTYRTDAGRGFRY